jgi:hypothetical protein
MKRYTKHEVVRTVSRALKKIDALAHLYRGPVGVSTGWLPADDVLNALLPLRRAVRTTLKPLEVLRASTQSSEDPDEDTFGKVHFKLPPETFTPPCATAIPGPEAARQ